MKEGDGAAKTAQPPLIISSNSPNRSLSELFQKTVLIAETNLAKRLGNLERLKRCQCLEHFSAARDEWFTAWRIFLGTKKLAAFANDKEPTLEAMKNYVLEMLRMTDDPEVTIRNQAAVIYGAALDGDVQFFRGIAAAFRGHDRSQTKPLPTFAGNPSSSSVSAASKHAAPLDWCILNYWFAGLLWLMNSETGGPFSKALQSAPLKILEEPVFPRFRILGF